MIRCGLALVGVVVVWVRSNGLCRANKPTRESKRTEGADFNAGAECRNATNESEDQWEDLYEYDNE